MSEPASAPAVAVVEQPNEPLPPIPSPSKAGPPPAQRRNEASDSKVLKLKGVRLIRRLAAVPCRWAGSGLRGRAGGWRRAAPRPRSPQPTAPAALLQLPYSTSEAEILEFFSNYSVTEIAFVYEPDGRPSGLVRAGGGGLTQRCLAGRDRLPIAARSPPDRGAGSDPAVAGAAANAAPLASRLSAC